MDGVNYNKDINIDYNLLSETISKLKADNQKISDIVNRIYDNVIKINDEDIWKSPEKEELMNGLIPFLNDTKTSLYDDLSNCVGVLDLALNNYKENDASLSIGANELA